MPKYKWENPYDWLESKLLEWDLAQTRAELLSLARRLDFDTLQDLYQSDMDKDGYFEPIEEN
jgi:hypothetical protein